MRLAICLVIVVFLSSAAVSAADNHPDPLAAVGLATPTIAEIKPVTESLWGVTVTDPYRYMEALDPNTLDWMKKQGDYTSKVFAAIKPRAALE